MVLEQKHKRSHLLTSSRNVPTSFHDTFASIMVFVKFGAEVFEGWEERV